MFWIEDEAIGSKYVWKKHMSKDKVFADDRFIQLSAEVFNRVIIIVPVFHEDGYGDAGLIPITPTSPLPNTEPFYLLYYSESRFINGHYQSIQKIQPRSQLASIPESPSERQDSLENNNQESLK